MKRITRYFFEGLLLLVPLAATLYVVYVIFVKIDGTFNSIFKFKIPGTGFLLTILTIILVGFVSSNFLTKRLMRIIDATFTRLPFVKMIYTAVRDLMNAFVGDKKSFNKPVLVSVSPDKSIQLIGFMTREGLEHIGLSDKVAVYLPQSYNFAGNVIIVSRERVTPLSAYSGDVMAFIVSGGVAVK
ncbi:MAG: DUF502 domain-containing protein [Nitrospiraceae bacterium]|nr:MAG: DUF502 domain-containing protein [Nitrospiraceae bacterium]